MNTSEAIMAFSQSEKIKAALIMIAGSMELLRNLAGEEKRGAARIVYMDLSMLGHEVGLAKIVTGHEEWTEVERFLNKALVMFDSGIGEEALIHVSRALSQVTNIGQKSMSYLKEAKLL
jgi:phosphatidylglycerophosphate synthase